MNERKANGLRLYRLQAGLRQEDVAERAGITVATLSIAENGNLSTKTLLALARAYGVTLEQLAADANVPLYWVDSNPFPRLAEAERFSRRTGVPVTEEKE